MHIDGFLRFAPGRKLVTMSNADLTYWNLSAADIATLNSATDINGAAYTFVRLPLTANNVTTTSGTNLGYKGSYANYYVANNVVLVPFYNDPNDAPARALIAPLYPGRAVVGIDVRNLYQNGGMVHCVTQQQPAVPMKLDCATGTAGTMAMNFAGGLRPHLPLPGIHDAPARIVGGRGKFHPHGTGENFLPTRVRLPPPLLPRGDSVIHSRLQHA